MSDSDREFTGQLLRDSGGFLLHSGGRDYRLIMMRTPVDLVEKQVVVTGAVIGDEIEVEGIRPV